MNKYDKINILNECECPVCLLGSKQYDFYKCNHFLCTECHLKWTFKFFLICRSNYII